MKMLALRVALLAMVLLLPRLGHRQIVGSHEAVFPLVARDIVERGAWMDAHLRGLSYRNKPPLYPWAIAALSWPGGHVTEVTARLPVVAAAIGAVVLTLVLGARLFGRRAGLWAALILLTSVVFFDHALASIPDVPLLFFDLMAAVALWSFRTGGGPRVLLVFYLALALGVFTKGIPGLLPLAVALVWLTLDGGRRAVHALLWAPGLLLFGAITMLWLIPYLATVRGDGMRSAALWDWVGAAGVVSPRPLGEQIVFGALGFLPWTFVLPLALGAAFRARRVRAVTFTACWLLVPLVVICAMQQQRLRYLLPLMPAAALLVAWWLDREAREPTARRGWGAGILGVALAGVAGGVVALHRLDIALPAPLWAIGLVGAGLVLLATLAAAALWTARVASVVPALVGLSALLLFTGTWMVESWENAAWDFRGAALTLDHPARALAVAALADDHELLQVDFYLGRSLTPLRSRDALARHLETGESAVIIDASSRQHAVERLAVDPRGVRVDPILRGLFVVRDDRR